MNYSWQTSLKEQFQITITLTECALLIFFAIWDVLAGDRTTNAKHIIDKWNFDWTNISTQTFKQRLKSQFI